MDQKKKYRNSNTSTQNPYIGILFGLLLVLLLNGLLFPNIGKNQIIAIDYISFIEKVDEGKVRDVAIKDNQIYFTADDDGKTVTYKTGETNDPQLIERLLNAQSPNESHKITFNRVVPQENSPILNFFLYHQNFLQSHN